MKKTRSAGRALGWDLRIWERKETTTILLTALTLFGG
ncbi:hypothetical protein NC652_015987 [Populus alba x Populus x berolinensis]|nr:hypothetical protein NC652_015987 [Populus alba x Populus x berolinensis]